MDHYFTGTSGLLLPVPNKQYYPIIFKEKSRLCYYASLMNSIEINSSFYKIPQATTVKKWSEDVPDDFKFTFKLFREITHQPALMFDPATLSRFMEVISQIGHKKGCLLVQFPPSIRITQFRQLQLLMEALRANDPDFLWPIALEFRHPSWYIDELYELLEQYQMGLVIHDKSPANTPMDAYVSEVVYLRFHGPQGNYRGSYTEDVLYEYALYIIEWLTEGKKVFVYFNNTMGDAIANLNTLRGFVVSL